MYVQSVGVLIECLKKTVSYPLQTDDTVLTELSWIVQNRSGKFKKLSFCSADT